MDPKLLKPAAKAPAKPGPRTVRYAVRRSDATVFIWTEALGKRKDFEEVWAVSPEAALETDMLPDPRAITLQQLEAMSKDQLIVFGKVKLALELDGSQKKVDLLLDVKQAIFTLPPLDQGPEEVTVDTTKPLSPGQARTQAGV